jgi:hypothetical protein
MTRWRSGKRPWRSSGEKLPTTISAPAEASSVNIARDAPYGLEPSRSTSTRTSTPSPSFCFTSAAIRVPTAPAFHPNIRMCTDELAASTSAKMRGKKRAPSTHGSIVAAVARAKRSGAAGEASTAACAPAAVTASGGGGQLGRCGIDRTRR